MKISIITITYNNYNELLTTLASIPKSSTIESVVINGGQCEKTLKFLETYDGISLSELDKGISDAFNKGIRLSTAEYILFLNSGDTLINDDLLKKAFTAFSNDPELSYIYSNVFVQHPLVGKIISRPISFNRENICRMPFCHQTMIVRKKCFDEVGHFDINLRLSMDFDLLCRLLVFNHKGLYIPSNSILVDGAGVSPSNPAKVQREEKMILKRNHLWKRKQIVHSFLRLISFNIKSLLQRLQLHFVVEMILKLKHR